MKKLLYKLLLLAPVVISLTSCGLDLKEVYEGDGFNNPIYNKNFYTKYDERIAPKNDDDNPFSETSISSYIRNFEVVNQPYQIGFENAAIYDPEIVTKPLVNGINYHVANDDRVFYGDVRKANLIDEQFKNGYLSKLYDGWMICGGQHQLARVQLNERGFGQLFDKRLINKDYFAMQFKFSVNDPWYQKNHASKPYWTVPAVDTEIDLYVNFYKKVIDENKYDVIQIPIHVKNCPANKPDFVENAYSFVSFSLRDLNLQECCGYSINYTWNEKGYLDMARKASMLDERYSDITLEEEARLEHSLMLYEVLFPNSTWR